MDQGFIEFLEIGGLYQPFEMEHSKAELLFKQLSGLTWSVQLFCPNCAENITFLDSERPVIIHLGNGEVNLQLSFTCTKDHSTNAIYFLKYTDGVFYKIGQYPSPIDTDRRIPNQYTKYLGQPYYKYYRYSIALHQESYHIGAYVYLRRILEYLIEQASKQGITDGIISEAKYISLRVGERIKALNKYLPEYMVEHRKILYGVLSLGIHVLDEETCQDAYPILKQSIDFILDDIIEKNKRESAMKNTSAALGKLKEKFKVTDDAD